MGENENFGIYLWLVTLVAVVLLIWMGVQGGFYWSYPLGFLVVACVLSEWFVIKLPQGDRFTLSIIFILLALLFSPDHITPLGRVAGAVSVIAIGAWVGYGLVHRPPVLQAIFYGAQYVIAAALAGGAFVLVSANVPFWLVTTFHLPAVVLYVVVFSLLSASMVDVLNVKILQGEKLPKADPLFVIFLAPISLIVYYFFQTRQITVLSVVALALPLLGILWTFRLYINIDTEHGEVKQLYRISQSFVAAMSQEETVQKVSEGIAQAIHELVACDACLVYTRSEVANEYLLANLDRGEHGPMVVLPQQGLLGRVLASGSGTIINDVTVRQGRSSAELRWTARTAIMAYPLLAESQVVGLMVLVRYRRGFDAEQFRVVGIIANQAGVTLHNAQIYEQSLQRADVDQKLGILNHAAFMQKAQRVMGRAQLADQSVALLLGDIDDFRKVNNTFGHATGDKILAGVADLMKQTISDSAFVGRRGGEEFVILVPNTDEQAALGTAEDIRRRVQEHTFESVDGQAVHVTISTGVALFPRDANDVVSLDRLADRAAYLAKRLGKNRVCLYEDQKEKIEFAGSTVQSSPPAQVQSWPG